MGRHPAARQKVIDASRRIVMERGAGCLTFDEIAQVSGVTRGGITYHFPTKQALLRALVHQDIAQWKAVESELKPDDQSPETAELLAFLRAHTHEDPDRRRFVTGMLGAATLDPPILDPARQFERERFEGIEWNDRTIRLQLLRMAAMGLFWADLFGCPEIEADVRDRLVSTLEALALEWSADGAVNEHRSKED